jgi:alcohol dehydrogenase
VATPEPTAPGSRKHGPVFGIQIPAGFDFNPRTRLVFGENSIDSLGELVREFGGKRVLVVTDSGIVRAGHAERAKAIISKAGPSVSLYDKVSENPTTHDVSECVAFAKIHDIDFIVGLGGGSSMDTAKGTNFIFSNGGKMADYWGVNKASKAMLPMIAVPTTAGTGSECQAFALIADEKTHLKMACGDEKAYARAAVLDPRLTLSMPRGVTANTGIDTVVHALEAHVCNVRSPISQLFSSEAWRLAECSLETVLREPGNVDARGKMLLASAYAGIAIAQAMLGIAHSAANPLSAHYKIIHGQAVGMMLPHVVRFNSADANALQLYADLAATAGLARAGDDPQAGLSALLNRVNGLLNAAQIPASLKDAGVPREGVEVMSTDAAKQWTVHFNPRKAGAEDFRALYSAAFDPRPAATPARPAR